MGAGHGFLKAMGLDGHHIVEKQHLKELLALKRHNRRFRDLTQAEKNAVNATVDAVKDTMPGYPLRKNWHVLGQGPKRPDGTRGPTIHDLIKKHLKSPDREDTYEDWKQAFDDAYDEFNAIYGLEADFDFKMLWQDANQWLDSIP